MSTSQIADLSDEDLVALARQGQYGCILQYYRFKAGWKARELAQLYAEAIRADGEEQPISPAWIYMMEHKNMVPIDPRRREILARILDIPLAYFGLEAAADNVSTILKQITRIERVDPEEYHQVLARYTWGTHDRSAFASVVDIQRRIISLQNNIPYVPGKERKRLIALLCGYNLVAGDLADDQMDYDTAIRLFKRAATLAKHEQLYDIRIIALKELSNAYRELAEITTGFQGRAVAQENFEKALKYHLQAQSLKGHVQPVYRGLIDISMGVTLSFCARDSEDLRNALKTIDSASTFIGETLDERTIPVASRLDQELYFIERAVIMLVHIAPSSQSAKSALQALEQARKTPSGSLTRKGHLAELEARALLLQGKYEMATAYAEAAVDDLNGSRLNLTRLEIIHRQLRASPYGKSTDVARLGLALLRAQRPELFAG